MQRRQQTYRIGIATDGGTRLAAGHFGEAGRFVVVEFDGTQVLSRREVDNPTSDAGHDRIDHGHEGTATAIGRLMAVNGVQILVSRAFGPNIRRMTTRFLPVVVRGDTVDQALDLLRANWQQVITQWHRGEERRHLVLRP
jgi:predicted Fe-Mo cluster-binding NifX family protein